MSLENAIFWIEVEKIVPNPYQPRREFDPDRLKELSDSIRVYGVLQPLVVSKTESHLEDGSVRVLYELIAGERRLRASKLAGLAQVPVVVRIGDDNRAKLELAIIENIQRQDLNSVERAKSFQQLADEFKLTWSDIAKKVGKSREYVNNTVRILQLPTDILDALQSGKISEGHTRPLLMLGDRPAEQMTLFKEMMIRKMSVREAESIARKVAYERVRKAGLLSNPEVVDMEERISSSLGTRVSIEPKERGGSITISYFSHDELLALSHLLRKVGEKRSHKGMFEMMDQTETQDLAAHAPKRVTKEKLHDMAAQRIMSEASIVTEALMRSGDPEMADSVAKLVGVPDVTAHDAPSAPARAYHDAPRHEASVVVAPLPSTELSVLAGVPGDHIDTVVTREGNDAVSEDNVHILDDRTPSEVKESEQADDEDMYRVSTFTI